MAPFFDSFPNDPTPIAKLRSGTHYEVTFREDARGIPEIIKWCVNSLSFGWNIQLGSDHHTFICADSSEAAIFRLAWKDVPEL